MDLLRDEVESLGLIDIQVNKNKSWKAYVN